MPLDFSKLPDVTHEHPKLPESERWLAAHALARDRALEAALGPTHPPGTLLAPEDDRLRASWPGGGFHRYSPSEGRDSWLFVTHGLSQPFDESDVMAAADDPEALSGLGLEYVLACSEDAPWGLEALLGVVRHTLFDREAPLLEPGGHVACATALGGRGALMHLLATLSPEYEFDLVLPAGHCVLVHLVGITEAELRHAQAEPDGLGGIILERVLYAFGIGGRTDPDRACTTTLPDFDDIWSDVRAEVREELAEDA